MARRDPARPEAEAERQEEAPRVQLGPYWLWHRAERDDWCICWYDESARATRRLQTGVGGGGPGDPPIEAQEALAAHFTANARPAEPQQPTEARVSELLSLWITDKDTLRLARAAQYGYSVKHWERFFDQERKTGKVAGPVLLDHLKKKTVDRFIRMRKADGVCGETIHGDLVALRRCLKYAYEEELIASVPFIKDVDGDDRSDSREIEYDIEQVAAILEAAARREDRRHVLLFSLIMLSSHSRCEAVLELFKYQIQNWIFHFNAPGRKQTSKRRSKVPVCSILRPWLADIAGKVIVYRAPIAERKWKKPGVPEYFERDCYDVGKAFQSCLIDAGHAHPSLGLCKPLLDDDGNQKVRIMASGEERPLWKGLGSPNALRHTCHTYHQSVGTPQGQIDMAAGHSEPGSGRNYSHLRPEYLKEFMAATEAYWEEVGRLTKVHLRDHVGATIVPLRR